MIEIKSRYSDKVLYTAENAADIKQALEAAVKDGAYLRGAYLDGAYLSGAYLRGAYLDGAHLSGAYLDGAYLRGAHLRGAYLDGAYLRGAHLRGAYLDGAYLDGAYLDGAYLRGAYLDGAIWERVAATLRTSLNAMNDGGRHWIKGVLQKCLDDGSEAYCSVGSVEAHSEGTVRAVATWLLFSVCGGSIPAFNDHEDTTWEDVQAVFNVAIKHAERFAKEAM